MPKTAQGVMFNIFMNTEEGAEMLKLFLDSYNESHLDGNAVSRIVAHKDEYVAGLKRLFANLSASDPSLKS